MPSLLDSLFLFSGKPKRGNCSGVLIVSSGGLGDTVLFSHVFERFSKLAEPGEQVTLLLRNPSEQMSFLFPQNISVFSINFEALAKNRRYKKKVFRMLYESNFRLVISTDFLRHPLRDEELIRCCKAQSNLAMEPRNWPKYKTKLMKNRRIYDRLFESGPIVLDKVVRWSRFANWLNNENLKPPQLVTPPETLPKPVLYDQPLIVFVPFSAVKEKQVPAQIFEQIADKLLSNHQIIVTGTQNELDTNIGLRSLLQRENVTFNPAKFEALVPILRAAQLVISVDTATMHLAVSIGTQTLCLASAAFVSEIVPYAEEITPQNAHFIYTPRDCQSCLGNCSQPLVEGIFPCVKEINSADVIQAVKSLVKEEIYP